MISVPSRMKQEDYLHWKAAKNYSLKRVCLKKISGRDGLADRHQIRLKSLA